MDSPDHSEFLNEVYHESDPEYSGRCSVPVLWDKQREQIVTNESEGIMRMLNAVLNDFLPDNAPERRLHFY